MRGTEAALRLLRGTEAVLRLLRGRSESSLLRRTTEATTLRLLRRLLRCRTTKATTLRRTEPSTLRLLRRSAEATLRLLRGTEAALRLLRCRSTEATTLRWAEVTCRSRGRCGSRSLGTEPSLRRAEPSTLRWTEVTYRSRSRSLLRRTETLGGTEAATLRGWTEAATLRRRTKAATLRLLRGTEATTLRRRTEAATLRGWTEAATLRRRPIGLLSFGRWAVLLLRLVRSPSGRRGLSRSPRLLGLLTIRLLLRPPRIPSGPATRDLAAVHSPILHRGRDHVAILTEQGEHDDVGRDRSTQELDLLFHREDLQDRIPRLPLVADHLLHSRQGGRLVGTTHRVSEVTLDETVVSDRSTVPTAVIAARTARSGEPVHLLLVRVIAGTRIEPLLEQVDVASVVQTDWIAVLVIGVEVVEVPAVIRSGLVHRIEDGLLGRVRYRDDLGLVPRLSPLERIVELTTREHEEPLHEGVLGRTVDLLSPVPFPLQ